MNWLPLSIAAAGGTLAYMVGRYVFDDVYQRARVWQDDAIQLEDRRLQIRLNALQHIPADANRRLGAIQFSDGTVLHLDTGDVYDRGGIRVQGPADRVRIDRLERIVAALPSGAFNPDQLAVLEGDQAPQIPEFVDSRQVMDAAPSYRRLVLGRTEHTTVTADMANLVHIAVGGSSGWGKSVFLRWLVYQLVKSTDPLHLVLIDLEGTTLGPFANSERVLYPVADTEVDAVAVMVELTEELDRRKELFGQCGGVDNLYEYNEVATEKLDPIVVVIDEATALLANKMVEGHLRTLALRSRKYGMWLVLAGQDWKATSLDSAIKNMLGARIQFKAMSSAQSRVLINQSGAEELSVKGRAIAVLPGRDPITFQSPLIKQSDVRTCTRGGPLHEMPVLEDEDEDFDARVKAKWDAGIRTKSDMCRELGGQPSGSFFYKVTSAGKRLGLPWK